MAALGTPLSEGGEGLRKPSAATAVAQRRGGFILTKTHPKPSVSAPPKRDSVPHSLS